MNHENDKYFRLAYILAIITVFYNLAEGAISVLMGIQDETLSLFGFGVDSFVEVFSGIGIWHMLYRMRNSGTENKDAFEKTALKITGYSFYILTAGLLASSAINIYHNHKPETTFWGAVIGAVSILSMWLLIKYKLVAGRALNSKAIIADANCTKTCMYLSVILLVSSIGYEITGLGFIDSIGALGIAYYSFREGKESIEKSKSDEAGCSCDHCNTD